MLLLRWTSWIFAAATLFTTPVVAADERGGMRLSSPAFGNGSEIPAKFTCDGANVSPPLMWQGAPPGTKSFVLIVDDPDAPDPAAPRMTWVHWVLYNLPASATGLEEGVRPADLPQGARQGTSDFSTPAYGGPCPPVGRHRYFHKLYALDIALPDLGKARKAEVERAMKGHVLAESQLVGMYAKKR